MAKIRINKLEAGCRQIDAVISHDFFWRRLTRGLFNTVIAGGNRIIRDLCESQGDVEAYLQFTDWINPAYADRILGATPNCTSQLP